MAGQTSSSARTAVVTGSSTGIGKAIAIRLAQSGFNLVLHGRQLSRELSATKNDIEQLGVCVEVVTCDFVDCSLSKFVDDVRSKVATIDVWVNNAGADVLTGEQAEKNFANKLDVLLTVDVKATLLLSQLAGHWMVASRNESRQNPIGSIINISWDQALSGIAGESGQLFSTTKGAIRAMTGSLAKSFAPQVRVNCVAPGWIKTEWGETASDDWQQRAMNESLLARWGTPQDVANVVAFLASPEAEFVNGQTIAVNGGFSN